MSDFKKILFATDFSKGSEKAFSLALSLARKYRARLDVVHVVQEMLDITEFYVPHISVEVIEREMEEAAEVKIKDFCKDSIKDVEYETHIKRGVPFKGIIETAEAVGADVIVMGTHGRSGVDHVLFGSTAEKVVRKSTLPVLTVRAD